MSCEKIRMPCSGSMSQQRFKISVTVHTDDTCFSTAEPFVTKLHLAMHHHDLESPLKRIDSLSSRSRSQWRFIYILCLFLPYLLDCWPICNHQTLFCFVGCHDRGCLVTSWEGIKSFTNWRIVTRGVVRQITAGILQCKVTNLVNKLFHVCVVGWFVCVVFVCVLLFVLCVWFCCGEGGVWCFLYFGGGREGGGSIVVAFFVLSLAACKLCIVLFATAKNTVCFVAMHSFLSGMC